jgi:hypothetical protein
LSFLSLEWKRFRYFGSMIQATRSQRTLQTINPTRASVNIESKVRLWIFSFIRKPRHSYRLALSKGAPRSPFFALKGIPFGVRNRCYAGDRLAGRRLSCTADTF